MMIEDELIVSIILIVVGLSLLIWLPLRIRAVWHGEKSAPPINRRKYYLFIGYRDWITERTFPMAGLSFACLAGLWVSMGLWEMLIQLGVVRGTDPVIWLMAVFVPLGAFFGFLTLIISLTGEPEALIPPSERGKPLDAEAP